MGAIELLPSLKRHEFLNEAQFLAFLQTRSEDERWELIDGEPVQMPPATKAHNRIAANFERLLNSALSVARPELDALREVPLSHPTNEGFRPIADLAVIAPADELVEHSRYYFDRFFLAAEILSPSNTQVHVRLKRERYAENAFCLYILIISQTDFAVEVWSRANDWQGRVYRSPDDRIELPEFGFSCALKDLYRGTPIK